MNRETLSVITAILLPITLLFLLGGLEAFVLDVPLRLGVKTYWSSPMFWLLNIGLSWMIAFGVLGEESKTR